MLSPNKEVFFADYTFHVPENVYEPAEDSFLFAEYLRGGFEGFVLDMGAGCGILTIILAAKADKVVAVDINPYAVRCTKKNAEINGVLDQIFSVQGNLFCPLRADKKFDAILFNAPYLPSSPSEGKTWIELAWIGGVTGRSIIDRFIHESPKYVKSDGCILLLQSSLSDIPKTLQKFEHNHLTPEIIARKDLPFFEEIVLIQAGRSNL